MSVTLKINGETRTLDADPESPCCGLCATSWE